jgi:hypothetical protein
MESGSPARRTFLIGEVVTSSGPRKLDPENSATSDMELGEDCGGVFLIDNGTAWAWVADGTSDTSKSGPFSSRILAQDLGRAFSSGALSAPDGHETDDALCRCIQHAIDEVGAEWAIQITHSAGLRETLAAELRDLQQRSGDGAAFLEFSSTFTAARLDRTGRCQISGAGDSYLLFNAPGKTAFHALERGQITFRIANAGGNPELKKSVPALQTTTADHVRLLFLSTDGARDTIRFLYETLGDAFEPTPENLRRLKKQIARIRPKTQDDKTLALLARLHDG